MSGTITVAGVSVGGGNINIQVVFKNCVPFTNCISEINNARLDNANVIYVVVSMYNLIEYSNNYSKTLRRLWQFYRDEPALNDNDTLAHFPGNSASFRFRQKITGSTVNDGTRNVEIMV